MYMHFHRYISSDSAGTQCHVAALPFTVHSVINTAATHLKQQVHAPRPIHHHSDDQNSICELPDASPIPDKQRESQVVRRSVRSAWLQWLQHSYLAWPAGYITPKYTTNSSISHKCLTHCTPKCSFSSTSIDTSVPGEPTCKLGQVAAFPFTVQSINNTATTHLKPQVHAPRPIYHHATPKRASGSSLMHRQ